MPDAGADDPVPTILANAPAGLTILGAILLMACTMLPAAAFISIQQSDARTLLDIIQLVKMALELDQNPREFVAAFPFNEFPQMDIVSNVPGPFKLTTPRLTSCFPLQILLLMLYTRPFIPVLKATLMAHHEVVPLESYIEFPVKETFIQS